MRKTATMVATLATAACVWLPAAANADGTISEFRVTDTGGRIVHKITVCLDHPHTVRFVTYLEPEDGWPTYRTSYVDHDPAGCWVHTLSRRDIFAEGFWFGRVKVAIGPQIRSSRWREFYVS